jgi:hypothetical protein
VKTTLLAAALFAAAVISGPMAAAAADNPAPPPPSPAPADPPGGPAHWMHGHAGGPGMGGWPMMMMHHRMMAQDPKERCTDRLAWRAARSAYVEAKLNLTAEQRPLWDKVQAIAKGEEQKERQLCDAVKAPGTATILDRMDRMQQFLSTRLDALQSAKPAVEALYQALTPDQRAVLDHPFRR